MRMDWSKTLPKRRFIDRENKPPLDEHGFLSEHFLSSSVSVKDLFAYKAVLIIAPPWAGKTFLAKQLDHHFSENVDRRTPDAPFGSYFHSTFFERHGLGSNIMPEWWKEWRRGSERACWIVDAFDEDARRQGRQAHIILDEIERLGDDKRNRLLLLMSSRENEIPAEMEDRIDEIYGPFHDDDGLRGFRVLRLTPLDASIARDIVGSDERFKQVCDLITKNRLQAIASLPSVLESLKRELPETSLSVREVWRDVLDNLLRDPRRERDEDLSPIDDRFRATSRIAATLTFSGQAEVDAGLGQSVGPGLLDPFPATNPQSQQLRDAARTAVKSDVFQRTATGYRFAQFHVQEWFTAF